MFNDLLFCHYVFLIADTEETFGTHLFTVAESTFSENAESAGNLFFLLAPRYFNIVSDTMNVLIY